MTDEERIVLKQAAADQAASYIRECMALMRDSGMPWDSIIAGAHAEVVSAMTLTFGGQMASDACARAAERVYALPSAADHALACAPAAGSA
jgi:hypothetical protein